MNKVSLQISLSPRDYRFITYLLPHQLRVWHDQVEEVLLVYDRHGYTDDLHQNETQNIISFIDDLAANYNKIRLIDVDYSPAAKKEISKVYFNGKWVPNKTHRNGPYYSYFYGLHHTRYNYVFHIDCDMFFGGSDKNWISEAIHILENEPDVITCSPLPGPPTANGTLLDQAGKIDNSAFRKVYFDSISTRLFLLDKSSFIKAFCPLPIKIASWPLLYRALLRRKSIYALPEDVLTDIMVEKGLKRVDFLGTSNGIWSLHPPYRNEEFFEKLPALIRQIETGDIPVGQRGYYDINDSMVDWTDARTQIAEASIKRRIINLLRFKK